MAIIEIREHAFVGNDAGGRTVPAPAEPALAVHFENTGTGAKTVQLDAQTTVIQIFSTPSVDVNYEVARSSPNSSSGAKRGTIPAAALPFAMPVEPGMSIQVSE